MLRKTIMKTVMEDERNKPVVEELGDLTGAAVKAE